MLCYARQIEKRFGSALYQEHAKKMSTWDRRTLLRPPSHAADDFFCGLISYHAMSVLRMAISERVAAACAVDRGYVRG